MNRMRLRKSGILKMFLKASVTDDHLCGSTRFRDFFPRALGEIMSRYVQRTIDLAVSQHAQPMLRDPANQAGGNKLLRADLGASFKSCEIPDVHNVVFLLERRVAETPFGQPA